MNVNLSRRIGVLLITVYVLFSCAVSKWAQRMTCLQLCRVLLLTIGPLETVLSSVLQ